MSGLYTLGGVGSIDSSVKICWQITMRIKGIQTSKERYTKVRYTWTCSPEGVGKGGFHGFYLKDAREDPPTSRTLEETPSPATLKGSLSSTTHFPLKGT